MLIKNCILRYEERLPEKGRNLIQGNRIAFLFAELTQLAAVPGIHPRCGGRGILGQMLNLKEG